MAELKLTPLTRLAFAIENELSLLQDPAKESVLAEKYLARTLEAASRRDSVIKGLLFLDALLAMAVSGKNVQIPGVGISMADIPALVEVLLGLVSFAAYIGSHAFMNWLCYSQIHSVFSNRIARERQLDPDLFELSDTLSEPTLKMLRPKANIWGRDWRDPGKTFSVLTRAYGLGNGLLFLMLPVLHLMLVSQAVIRTVSTTEVSMTGGFFLAWVLIAHILALFVWVTPMIEFTFFTPRELDSVPVD